ncbi:hypothetical protein BVC80_1451g3 [Macleaya cordata]|uniref:Uncharacterized protein n=1 Tax=Macleaya cordata TaxID=56857 RepID=A0A200PPG0_MACCD|nr:hypothetical protein BVC80_1451g3 [Macleaya cordata]
MEQCSQVDILQICGSRNFDWIALPSNGASGGMLILWHKDTIEVSSVLEANYSLTIECSNKIDHFH